MDVRSISRMGQGDINQDACVVNLASQVFAVIDGVTSGPAETAKNGGFVAAKHLSDQLASMGPTDNLDHAIRVANVELRNHMARSGVNLDDKTRLWSAAFVAVKLQSTHLEYVHAGDCMLLLRYGDGSTRVVTHNFVSRFDEQSIKMRVQLRRNGVDAALVEQKVFEVIEDQRRKTNTLAGYGIFNGEYEFMRFCDRGFLSRANLRSLYLLTDGLFYPTADINRSQNWDSVLDIIDRGGIEEYANQIEQIERDDGQCIRFPRHKVSDDKTGIVIHFEDDASLESSNNV